MKKIITIKRKKTESKEKKNIERLVYFLYNQHAIRERQEKKKSIGVELCLATIHVPLKEKEHARTHQMTWRKLDFNHRCQPHVLAAFFLCAQNKKYPQD
jgi:hypothetical protein